MAADEDPWRHLRRVDGPGRKLDDVTTYYLVRYLQDATGRALPSAAAAAEHGIDAAQVARAIARELATHRDRVERLWHDAHSTDAPPPAGWSAELARGGARERAAVVGRMVERRQCDADVAAKVGRWCRRAIGSPPAPSQVATKLAGLAAGGGPRTEYLFAEPLDRWIAQRCPFVEHRHAGPRLRRGELHDAIADRQPASAAQVQRSIARKRLAALVPEFLRSIDRMSGGLRRALMYRELQRMDVVGPEVRAAWLERVPSGTLDDFPLTPACALDVERYCYPQLGADRVRRAVRMAELRASTALCISQAHDAAARGVAQLVRAGELETATGDVEAAALRIAPTLRLEQQALVCRELQRGSAQDVARRTARAPELFARYPLQVDSRADVAWLCYPGKPAPLSAASSSIKLAHDTLKAEHPDYELLLANRFGR